MRTCTVEILEEYKNTYYLSQSSLKDPIPDMAEDPGIHFLTSGRDYHVLVELSTYAIYTAELEMHRLNGMLPVCEDWHAKVCLMEVRQSAHMQVSSVINSISFYHRHFGRGCTAQSQAWKEGHCASLEISLTGGMSLEVPPKKWMLLKIFWRWWLLGTS